MFKFSTLGKLNLINLNFIVVFISVIYFAGIIFLQLEIGSDLGFQLETSITLYFQDNIRKLFLLFIINSGIHIVFSIQSLFFDYINPKIGFFSIKFIK